MTDLQTDFPEDDDYDDDPVLQMLKALAHKFGMEAADTKRAIAQAPTQHNLDFHRGRASAFNLVILTCRTQIQIYAGEHPQAQFNPYPDEPENSLMDLRLTIAALAEAYHQRAERAKPSTTAPMDIQNDRARASVLRDVIELIDAELHSYFPPQEESNANPG